MTRRVDLLTGPRGIGKSTICQKLVRDARQARLACAGLVTLRASNGVREVLDVGTGITRGLTVAHGATGAIVVQGRFRFDPQTIAWGNEVLIQAPPGDLLIVDELGPLELRRGGGWQAAFDRLARRDFALALVVVRPELLDRAQERLGPVGAVWATTRQSRDDLPRELMEHLLALCAHE